MTDSGEQDPAYKNLVKREGQQGALHNYYSEFRLGHGDPLMKSSMESWPYTSTKSEDEELVHDSKNRRPDNGKRVTTVSLPYCSTVSNPLASPFVVTDILNVDKREIAKEEKAPSEE